MGAAAWEAARVLDGRPMAGKELTEQHLPLEAGLYHAVSLNKGCYMGQETLAKVHKLNAVKQQLHGLLLDADVPPGSPLLSGTQLDVVGVANSHLHLSLVPSMMISMLLGDAETHVRLCWYRQ